VLPHCVKNYDVRKLRLQDGYARKGREGILLTTHHSMGTTAQYKVKKGKK